ncbi:MAG TPA: hypothetical protein VFB28_11205 [Terriglobales bacterium]|nr:hypothetical protein [Terriglobales bacterium]
MKKIGLLLILTVALGAYAQEPAQGSSDKTVTTNVNFPIERVATPTNSDIYCAGFVNKAPLPDANFIAGGVDTPNTTKYGDGEIVYLSGKGYELDKRYSIVRALHDPNRFETYAGQQAMLKSMGQPYADLGILRVVDVRSKMAIAKIELSCNAIMTGDVVVPFVEKPSIAFHQSVQFDRFAPANGKTTGRIVLAKDFDSELGTGHKVYLNLGANQGIKAGDYFRAVRSYEGDLHNPVDSLSFKASAADDTQAKPPSMEPTTFTHSAGPAIHVADFPRRAVGEIVILSTTPTTSTGMIVFAIEDVHIGDVVELDPQQ